MPSRTSDQPTPARTASSALVLPLTQIDRTMISQVGGKAANLGELTRAGFAVPQGFCVTHRGLPGGRRAGRAGRTARPSRVRRQW